MRDWRSTIIQLEWYGRRLEPVSPKLADNRMKTLHRDHQPTKKYLKSYFIFKVFVR